MPKVAFQGEHGAYSEAAAIKFFGGSVETVPCPTFYDAVASTEEGSTEYALLPVENSLEGSVGESCDLLASTRLHAVGEVYQRINHCLIGFGRIEGIDTVYSHPQALGQCRKFIQDHRLRAIPTYDTAGSVKIILELKKDNVSCIASRNAAEMYGAPIIKEGIEDNANNYTRFLLLSRREGAGAAGNKTSIIFSIRHVPGALYKVIGEFNEKGVNLTRIESRPTKSTPWEYNFYVDFEGDLADARIRGLLEGIRPNTTFLKIVGCYHSAEMY